MYSYPQKKVQITEPLPCPECAELQVVHVKETTVLSDGVKVSKLEHYKCTACGSHFYDDQAMQVIRDARKSCPSTAPTSS